MIKNEKRNDKVGRSIRATQGYGTGTMAPWVPPQPTGTLLVPASSASEGRAAEPSTAAGAERPERQELVGGHTDWAPGQFFSRSFISHLC